MQLSTSHRYSSPAHDVYARLRYFPCLVAALFVASLHRQPQLRVLPLFRCDPATMTTVPQRHVHSQCLRPPTVLAGVSDKTCSLLNTWPFRIALCLSRPSVFIGVIGKGHAQPLASISSTEGTRVLVEGVFKAEGSPMDWGVWVDEGSGRQGI